MRTVVRVLVTAWAILAPGVVFAQSLTFVQPPVGFNESYGVGVSADGRIAGGWSEGAALENRGWFWTPEGGRQDIPTPPVPLNSRVGGLSGDGATLVGWANSTRGSEPFTAFRYSAAGGFQSLGLMAGFEQTKAVGASGDGSVVVGYADNRVGASTRGFRWSLTGGMEPLPLGNSRILAVSRDGAVSVGHQTLANGITAAIMWPAAGSPVYLTGLPGSTGNRALGVNQNGRIVVGTSQTGTTAAIWRDGVVESLGLAPGYARSRAYGVNDDGTVIVGVFDIPETRAGIWRQGFGWQPLHEYLAGFGLSVPPELILYDAVSVSSDGRTIVGTARSPGGGGYIGYIATVPSASSIGVMLLASIGGSLSRRRSLSP